MIAVNIHTQQFAYFFLDKNRVYTNDNIFKMVGKQKG